ncbi:MAG: non-canonical purine NTP pyrophosphatase [Candidatus Paceibacterota bacterium]
MKILYVTGNSGKFGNAQKFFQEYNIDVEQRAVKIEEIQSGDSLEIAIDKAKKAFAIEQKPLFINDATWIIPALKGFPGPFMKYINQWFEPIDFIHLMEGKGDRRIILRDIIIYIDDTCHKVFTHDHEGSVLNEVASYGYKHSTDVVISLSKSGKSIAEEKENKNFFVEDEDKVWRDFVQWLQTNNID